MWRATILKYSRIWLKLFSQEKKQLKKTGKTVKNSTPIVESLVELIKARRDLMGP